MLESVRMLHGTTSIPSVGNEPEASGAPMFAPVVDDVGELRQGLARKLPLRRAATGGADDQMTLDAGLTESEEHAAREHRSRWRR